MNRFEKEIAHLCKSATEAVDSASALEYSQAALNLSHIVAMEENTKRNVFRNKVPSQKAT